MHSADFARLVNVPGFPASARHVWHALSDSTEFGDWFGVRFDAPFAPAEFMRGVITPTTVDATVASAQKPCEGMAFKITVEEMRPEQVFSFRRHPFAVETGIDYPAEPPTLVVFALEETPDGILLTITEAGFDQIPVERHEKAFAANEQGWGMVINLIGKYLSIAAWPARNTPVSGLLIQPGQNGARHQV